MGQRRPYCLGIEGAFVPTLPAQPRRDDGRGHTRARGRGQAFWCRFLRGNIMKGS